jgi:hypothetical protein
MRATHAIEPLQTVMNRWSKSTTVASVLTSCPTCNRWQASTGEWFALRELKALSLTLRGANVNLVRVLAAAAICTGFGLAKAIEDFWWQRSTQAEA